MTKNDMHTPGPWYALPHPEWRGGRWMITANHADDWPQAMSRGIARVTTANNARLIAAAPDLLAACGALLTDMQLSRDPARAIEMIAKAVAKAGG